MVLKVLSALGKPKHLSAVRMLRDGSEPCICDLMRALGASQSRMSRHLEVLKQAGLVVDRCDAQWVRYRLNPDMPENVRILIDATLMQEVVA